MTALLGAELLKLRTIRTFMWIALANALLVVLAAVSVAASTDAIQSAADDRSVAQIAAIAILFALVAGIIVMAGEATHGTITQTLLVTPLRERVLLGKALVAAVLGLVLALLSEILVIVIAVPGASLDAHNARAVFLGILIGATLAGALGVGVGALVHSQGAGIAITLVWLLIGEHIAPLVSRSFERHTPGRSFAALASGVRHGDALLGMSTGGVASAAWTAAFLAAGLFAFLRRDV
jgi:ABC-2 type transport system permease protein